MEFSAQQIAGLVGGTIEGNPAAKVNDFAKIEHDGDRDYWMNAEEAKAYGMIDEVLVREKAK